jgi:parvulin-like peptidyl-prolyl isomerase
VSNPLAGPTETPTASLTPTVTPVPMAISVNGERITQAEFDAELARYQQAQAELGISVSQETAVQAVRDGYVDTLLLAQGAAQNGHVVDENMLQARIDALAGQIGGVEALAAWQAAHGYTLADFRSELRRQMAAAWMRDQVVAAVPVTAEQVHVKQILLYNEETAQTVLTQLQSGWTFPDLAASYDPLTNGELGWVVRGYLPDPAVEQAIFALQPGQYSGIVQTQAGYHIFYVVESDPARTLSPDALLTLQEKALREWLQARRDGSSVEYGP